jgi:hypothetical protein
MHRLILAFSFLLAASMTDGRPTSRESLQAQASYFYASEESDDKSKLKQLIAEEDWWVMRESFRFAITSWTELNEETEVTLAFQHRMPKRLSRFEGTLRLTGENGKHLGDYRITYSNGIDPLETHFHVWTIPARLSFKISPSIEWLPKLIVVDGTAPAAKRTTVSVPHAGYIALPSGERPQEVEAKSASGQPWAEMRRAREVMDKEMRIAEQRLADKQAADRVRQNMGQRWNEIAMIERIDRETREAIRAARDLMDNAVSAPDAVMKHHGGGSYSVYNLHPDQRERSMKLSQETIDTANDLRRRVGLNPL